MSTRNDRTYERYRRVVKFLISLCVTVHIQGLENIPAKGSFIIAANHLKMIDSFVIGAFLTKRRVHFAAKVEYFRGIWGMTIGRLMRQLEMIPVDRKSRNALPDLVKAAVEVLVAGGIFGIHPEGTRSRNGKLGKIKAGVIRIAWESACLIVPVGLHYKFRGWRLHVWVNVGRPLAVYSPTRTLELKEQARLRAQLQRLSGQELDS